MSVPMEAPARVPMRDEIKRVATRLLMLRGYRGVSYGDIAQELEITTTNIHYHFGPKARLVATVMHDYIEQVGGRYRGIWTDAGLGLAAKVEATVAFNREAFTRLNPRGDEGNSWSLITRLAAESGARRGDARQDRRLPPGHPGQRHPGTGAGGRGRRDAAGSALRGAGAADGQLLPLCRPHRPRQRRIPRTLAALCRAARPHRARLGPEGERDPAELRLIPGTY